MANTFFDAEFDYGKAAPMAKRYADYLAASEELYSKQGLGAQLRKLSGAGDEFAKHPMHAEFYSEMARMSQELSELLANREADENDARIAAEILLAVDGKERFDKNSMLSFGLIPVEQYAAPLFAYLDAASIAEIHKNYAARIGSYPLPLQEKILKELEKTMREKGVEVPEKKGFFERFFSKK